MARSTGVDIKALPGSTQHMLKGTEMGQMQLTAGISSQADRSKHRLYSSRSGGSRSTGAHVALNPGN